MTVFFLYCHNNLINIERIIGPTFRIIGRFIRIIDTLSENLRIEW
jgi:hypothetical protein